jgi:hypothetical protein
LVQGLSIEELEYADFICENPTEHPCAYCGDEIGFTDEVYLLKIVQAQLINGRIEYYDVLDNEGSFAYEPYFFEFQCWEALVEELTELKHDEPPITDTQALLDCDACESDIRPWEIFGLAAFGELHTSQKTPDGRPTTVFEDLNSYQHLCISCLYCMNTDNQYYPIIHGGLPDEQHCENGIHSRCWRWPGMCSCRHLRT